MKMYDVSILLYIFYVDVKIDILQILLKILTFLINNTKFRLIRSKFVYKMWKSNIKKKHGIEIRWYYLTS